MWENNSSESDCHSQTEKVMLQRNANVRNNSWKMLRKSESDWHTDAPVKCFKIEMLQTNWLFWHFNADAPVQFLKLMSTDYSTTDTLQTDAPVQTFEMLMLQRNWLWLTLKKD